MFLFQTNFVNWQHKAFDQVYDSSEMKKSSSCKRIVYLIFLLKRGLVTRIPISYIFSLEEKHFFIFSHISLWRHPLGGPLQK